MLAWYNIGKLQGPPAPKGPPPARYSNVDGVELPYKAPPFRVDPGPPQRVELPYKAPPFHVGQGQPPAPACTGLAAPPAAPWQDHHLHPRDESYFRVDPSGDWVLDEYGARCKASPCAPLQPRQSSLP